MAQVLALILGLAIGAAFVRGRHARRARAAADLATRQEAPPVAITLTAPGLTIK